MTRCIYCGTEVGSARLHRVDGDLLELLWWCQECSGKSWHYEWDTDRHYGQGIVFKTTHVPEGCLFVAKSKEL